jgi:hypothetical protein
MFRSSSVRHVVSFVAWLLLPASGLAQSAPGEIVGQTIPVPGEQVEGTTAKLSEVAARHQIWTLGLLANRGVETERIHTELRVLAQAPDEEVRYQAVAAIAYIGTDQTVPDLLRAFHHDPLFHVRIDGGGCGLAHCGMLTRAQRMLAVPGLIEMVEDRSLDPRTIVYGYRALREITDETLPDDPSQWRQWHAARGAETADRFRKFEH